MNLADHISFAYDLAKDVYQGRDLKLLLLGSWFPDMYITGVMHHSETHTGGERFLSYCEKNCSKYTPLAKGIILHQKADELFHNGYLREKIDSVKKRVAFVDKPFFERYAHGIIELGGAFIEKDNLPFKIREALKCRIGDLRCYLDFLGKNLKERAKVYAVVELGKLFYRFKVSSKEREKLDNLVINLSAFTLSSLTKKKVFKNGFNLPALVAGSFYYFFGKEKNLETIERMKRLILQAKEELEKDYFQYWDWVNTRLKTYLWR